MTKRAALWVIVHIVLHPQENTRMLMDCSLYGKHKAIKIFTWLPIQKYVVLNVINCNEKVILNSLKLGKLPD